MKQPKQYTGSVYIGVVGPEIEIGECRDSIEAIKRRPGDSLPVYTRATKGYEARQTHFDRWLSATGHPFALLLDHDMHYAPDTLERLRAHAAPYVSGFYMRRRFAPIAPVWFKLPPRHVFPMEPWSVDPERGQLHELGASGWGCILIHRDVAVAVRGLLKGEPEILEDDMDVWPYDLAAVVQALEALRTLTTEKISMATLRPALERQVDVLSREFRPLRGTKDSVGSDIRFPFYAREAGFVLAGDPDVRPSHDLHYPLSPDDYTGQPAEYRADLGKTLANGVRAERKKMAAGLAALKKGD